MPFISRRNLQTLRARVETYAQHARDARRVEQAALTNYARLAARFVEPGEVLTELAETRRQLEAKDRRINLLQDQLDELLGMNAPGVKAGAHWQARRTDKNTGVKP